MNFLGALQHAFIGYGIRRKAWNHSPIIYYDHDDQRLRFLGTNKDTDNGLLVSFAAEEGGDVLTPEDCNAMDWEVY